MLSEVRRFLAGKRVDIGLFGVNPEFEAEFDRRARELHAAIVRENDLPPSWLQLPDYTVLGDRSEELFNGLVEWTSRNEGDALTGLS